MAVYRPIRCKALSQEAMRGDGRERQRPRERWIPPGPGLARERFAALFASEPILKLAMRGDAADSDARANAGSRRGPAYARERFAALFASERASASLMRA
jgi:hypothetical protein